MSEEQQLTGHKNDGDKPRFDLIPQEALWRVAEVLSYGAAKYQRDGQNWRHGMLWHRPLAGTYRHMSAWQRGERFDRESGLPHLAHAIAGLLFLLTYEETDAPGDDRWKPIKPAEEERSNTIKSPHAMRPEMGPLADLPSIPAARLELIGEFLLGLPYHDEDGNIIGRGDPLITREQAMDLLGLELAQQSPPSQSSAESHPESQSSTTAPAHGTRQLTYSALGESAARSSKATRAKKRASRSRPSKRR